MPMPTHKKILLISILLLAFFLRSYRLDSYPPINPDEAAIGYNAYSLLKTGKDEHGISWPLHFKSFGDYKPGGYFYLVLPFIKILGLNTLAIRLPNLILSVITIYYVFLLVNLLSRSSALALISAFVLCVNPWHIHFSRGGWESSAAFSFIVIGSYFYFQFIKSNRTRHFLFFVLTFVASLAIYHSARIIAPLLAIFYFTINFKFLISRIKILILPLIIGTLLTLPILFSFLHGGGSSRFNGVGILADSGPYWRANELLNQDLKLPLFHIIHNKIVLYTLSWAEKYSSHFSASFLFINGDEVPRSKVPEMGQFYLFELPLLLGGIYLLRYTKYPRPFKLILIFWTLITPLASSLTFQAPSALRSLSLCLPISVFIAIFIDYLINHQSKITKYTVATLLTIAYLFFFADYLDAYYLHYLKRYPNSWSQSFDQVIPYLNSQKDRYENIYFTDKYDQPYILYLFYSQYPPAKIQSQIKLSSPDQFGFSTVRQIDNIHFEKIDWDKIPGNSLVISSDETVPIGPSRVFTFSNGQAAFKIYSK